MRSAFVALILLVAPAAYASQAADALYRRGKDLFAAGNMTAACWDFAGAVRVDPEHDRARSYLAECYALGGDPVAAQKVRAGASPDDVAPLDASKLSGAPVPESMAGDVPEAPAPAPPPTRDPTTVSTTDPSRAPPPTVERAPAPSPDPTAPTAAPAPAPAPPFTPAPPVEERVVDVEARRRTDAELAARRRADRNPRARDHFAAGVQAGGAAVIAGVYFELRPSWLGGAQATVGGFLAPSTTGFQLAMSVSGELLLTPVPFRLTPALGAGVGGFVGSAAPRIDDVLANVRLGGISRLVPYGVLGVRYDARGPFTCAFAVRLAPGATYWAPVVAIPGFTAGVRF